MLNRIALKRFFALVLLLGMSGGLFAQVVLEGKVRDGKNNKSLEFVNVGVVGAAKPIGTTTDRNGNYRFSVPPCDSVRVRFSFTGYEPFTVVLCYKDLKSPHRLNVELHEAATTLEEVKVTDEKSRTSSFTHIDIQKIENNVGPNDGVESLIKTLPDVSSNNELSSQYSVRGGSFDENLVYVNGVEVFRPMLVRSGQQEGMSIINPDLVEAINFSPGGFDASFGDKMSSVLDILYGRASEFRGGVSASLLGISGFVKGSVKDRFSYSVGLRRHSNRYIFSSLDTKGSYSTAYTDAQGIFSYKVNDKLDVSLLTLWTNNRYGLIPESQITTFGSFMKSLELDVYFDGGETDKYATLLGAVTFDWHPSEDFGLKLITSAQTNSEREFYDIQSQFWLYERGMGSDATVDKFDRGIGTFLEHARNTLKTDIFNLELKGVNYLRLGNLNWGVKAQYERIADHLKEWKWVDSAGYAMPTTFESWGVAENLPSNPILQFCANAENQIGTFRTMAFVQREWNFTTHKNADIRLLGGLRAQYAQTERLDAGNESNQLFLFSPRVLASYHPNWKRDILFRFAAGVYQQAPFYREMRRNDGSLNLNVKSQQSYQVMQSADWNFKMWDQPFKFTADLYYKYLQDIVPYTIDNLRMRYDADKTAVGYVAGLSLRLNGEFVKGLESWASLSIMQTQEDIEGDGLGWIARPTDQRISFKLFFQDYVPQIPWWRMSLSFIVGSGTPVTFPYQRDRSQDYRLPTYFRVDWGNMVQLSRFEKIKHSALMRHIDDILVGVEIFNLFDHRNVVSFIWVADYENIYYPVPNYLTARQFNVKVTVEF